MIRCSPDLAVVRSTTTIGVAIAPATALRLARRLFLLETFQKAISEAIHLNEGRLLFAAIIFLRFLRSNMLDFFPILLARPSLIFVAAYWRQRD